MTRNHITGREIATITINDPEGNLPVEITIIKLEGGGMIGVDTSFFHEEQPIYSPFDKGVRVLLPDEEVEDKGMSPSLPPELSRPVGGMFCCTLEEFKREGFWCYDDFSEPGPFNIVNEDGLLLEVADSLDALRVQFKRRLDESVSPDPDDDSNPSVGTPTADSIGVHDGVTEKPEPAFHVLNDHQVLYFTGGDGSDYLSHKDLPAMRTPMQANQYICIANNLSLPLVLIDATPLDDPKVAQFARQVCEALNRFGGESHDPETLSQLLAYDDDTTPDQLRANIDHVRGLLDKMVNIQSRREHQALLRIGAQHPAWSSNPDDKLVRIFNSVTAVAREAVNAQGNDDDQKADWCGAQMGDEVARLAHVQRGIDDAKAGRFVEGPELPKGVIDNYNDFDEFLDDMTHKLCEEWENRGGRSIDFDDKLKLNDLLTDWFGGKR